MKAKKLILNILASVGMVLLILPMCLAMYTTTASAASSLGSTASDPKPYGIFADWSGFTDIYKVADKTFASAWATITDVIAVILLVLAVVYVVLFVLQLLKVGKKFNYSKVLKVISVAVLILTVVALITAIIFTSANSLTLTGKALKVETKYTFGFGVGLIMLLVGGAVTGVMGLLANLKK